MSCEQRPIFCSFHFLKFSQNASRGFHYNFRNYDGLGLENLLALYEVPSACDLGEEVENVKIWFLSHNFIPNIGGATIYLRGTIWEHDEHLQQNMDLIS